MANNDEGKNVAKTGYFWLSFGICCFINLIMYGCGVFNVFRVYTISEMEYLLAFFVLSGVFVALIIFNYVIKYIIKSIVFKRNLELPSVCLNKYENTDVTAENVAVVRRKFVAVLVFSYMYVTAVLCMFAATSYIVGRFFGFNLIMPIAVLVAAGGFIPWKCVYVMIAPMGIKAVPTKFILNKAEFPELYGIAERAANAVGVRAHAKLYYSFDGMSSIYAAGTHYIGINYVYMFLLTRDELYNFFISAYARIKRGILRNRNRMFDIMMRWTATCPVFSVFFSNTYTCLFSYLIEMYYKLSHRLAVKIDSNTTDSDVKRLGDAQSFINGLAKMRIVDLYVDYNPRELYFDLYLNDSVYTDFATRFVDTFPAYYSKYGEIWKKLVVSQLTDFDNPSPTFAMRQKALGVDSIDVDDRETDETYNAELKKIIVKFDDMLSKAVSKGFMAMHYEKKSDEIAMREYYDAMASDKGLSAEKAYCALSAFSYVNSNVVITLADNLINAGRMVSRAYYFKGQALMREYDEACIECFSQAAQDIEYNECSYECLYAFAIQTGDRQLLHSCESTMPQKYMSALKKFQASIFDKNTKFLPYDLPSATVKEIVKTIGDIGGDYVAFVFLAKYFDADNMPRYAVVIQTVNANRNLKSDIIRCVKNYLSTFDGKYSFRVSGDAKFIKIMKAVEKSLVFRKFGYTR